MLKYRSRNEISAMILESSRAGATKTRIMYKAYLSYGQMTEYLRFLQESELLRFEEEKQLYRVTEKGLRFLNASYEINELMSTKPRNYNIIPNM
jgi:predicted transcriptional regulator